MSKHTMTCGTVTCMLLFFSVVLNVRYAVAVQAGIWLGSPVWMSAEELNEILPCCWFDVSGHEGIGKHEFEKRQSRPVTSRWDNTVVRWETHYPDVIGRMILHDLVTVTAIPHETQQESTSALGREDPESAKMWDSAGRKGTPCCPESAPSPFETSHEQVEPVVAVNTPQRHSATSPKREKRMPTGKEAMREGFVLEPIHLFLLGSGLIGLGALRNRHKRV